MSHTVFQMAQIMPVNTRISNKTILAPTQPLLPAFRHVAAVRVRRGMVVIKASAASVDASDSVAALERCFATSPASTSSATNHMDGGVVMKGKFGSLGAVTLEKSKLDMSKKIIKSDPKIDHGSGNNNGGKNNNLGNGDGGNDGGDDDDYTDDFDDGEDGDEGGWFRRRMILNELFDRKFLDAVMNEWQKTLMDLPPGLRQACEMGLVSSAQLVRFLAINARPTTERYISRLLPEGVSRAFIGRMIADPAFLHKLLLDQAATIGSSVWWEVKNRKHRLKQEWDLALLNVLTASACNAIVVWSLAPCLSYGNTFQFDLQNTLQKLPNNIFEKSYPLREFDMQKRIQSFIVKAGGLSAVGLIAGAAQGAISNFLAGRKEGRLSVTIPSEGTNALGYGAFLGLDANLRYQLMCGIDRSLINHFDVIGVALFFSTALRIMNVQLGERTRLAWLGVEVDPLVYSDDLSRAYSRPTENDSTSSSSSSNWVISLSAVVKGLGLPSITKQEDGLVAADGEARIPKPRRKRVVRKVTTRTA